MNSEYQTPHPDPHNLQNSDKFESLFRHPKHFNIKTKQHGV